MSVIEVLAAQSAPMKAWLAWSPFGLWCVMLFLTDGVSLVLDYAALAKLLLR